MKDIKKRSLGKEIESIELLRGIASIMVCYFHLARGNRFFLPDTSIVKQTATWGWSGVEIFFVISGFVIPYAMFKKAYKINNFFSFLKKRIIRIEPPYLVSIILVVILNFISTLSPYYRGTGFKIDWINLFSHIAYLNIFTGGDWLNDVYWSLAIEFQYYILMALVFPLIVSKKRWHRLIVLGFLTGSSFFLLLGKGFIFNYMIYFLSGIVLFQYYCNIVSLKEFCILILINCYLLFFKEGFELSLIVITTLTTIIYVRHIPSIFKQLGIISYSLYLIHIPIGGRIVNISQNFVNSVFWRECIVFVSLFICILISVLFYNYIEKIFKKLSAKINYKRNPDIPAPVINSLSVGD